MFKSLIQKEQGAALIAVAGATLLLIGVTFGLIVLLENANQKIIEYRSYQKALNLADAGVDHVTWLFKTKSFPESYMNQIMEIDFGSEGRCRFKVTEGSAGFEKIIYSVGYAPHGYKKAVKVTIFSMNIWDLLLSAGNQNPDRRPGGSGGIEGNGRVVGPLYVRGGLPNLSGTFDIYEGPLFIKNGILVKQSSAGYVGTSAEPIRAYIDGNEYGATFRKSGNSVVPIDPWSPGLNVYISNLSRKVPDIEFPALTPSELERLRNVASQEGADNILPSYPQGASKINFNESPITANVRTGLSMPGISNYKVIDEDGSINQSIGTLTLDTQKFGFVDVNSDGVVNNLDTQYFEFAFDGTVSPKSLYINGIVFIDGNLTINGPVLYMGKGTFIVNGSITINNTLLAGSNYPQVNALGLGVKRDTYINTGSANDDIDDVQVALFTEGDVVFTGNNSKFYGTLIAGFIDMTSAQNIKLVLADAMPGNLPPSLPASESNIVTIQGWKEIQIPEGF